MLLFLFLGINISATSSNNIIANNLPYLNNNPELKNPNQNQNQSEINKNHPNQNQNQSEINKKNDYNNNEIPDLYYCKKCDNYMEENEKINHELAHQLENENENGQ